MRKNLKTAISCITAVMLLVLSSASAFAASYLYYAGYYFSLSSGEASIHSYACDERDLYIPETLWGYTVTGIDDSAFFNRSDFTDLYLQEGKQLRTIGSSAFYGCSGFDYVSFPPSVVSIGESAFQGCTGIQTLLLNDGLTAIPQQGVLRLLLAAARDHSRKRARYRFLCLRQLHRAQAGAHPARGDRD